MAANKAILHIEFLVRNDARDAVVAIRFVNAAFHTAFLTRFRKISENFQQKYEFLNKIGIYEARVIYV